MAGRGVRKAILPLLVVMHLIALLKTAFWDAWLTSSQLELAFVQPKDPPKSNEERLFCHEEPHATVIFTDPAPEKPYDGCFISSIFGLSSEQSDKPLNASSWKVRYPNYAFFLYTNLVDLKTPGWSKVLYFDTGFRRMITESRYAKFQAWKDYEIQKHCPVVFYIDGVIGPKGSVQDFQEQSHKILQSDAGLAQRKHIWPLAQELRKIVEYKKDIQSNIDATKNWLEKQPDFDWGCQLYQNTFFGYNPTNPNFQKASDFFWDRYKQEQDSWRDQPLWCYTLYRFGLTPLPLEGKIFGNYFMRTQGGRLGSHMYDKDTSNEAEQFLKLEKQKACMVAKEEKKRDPPAEMDVVIVAGAINCATERTATNLRKYLNPPPRNIHLILPRHLVPTCRNVFADDVLAGLTACHSEQDVVPLTNLDFQTLFAAKGDPWTKLGDRAGWYLQQFVKLFAYKLLGPSLSSTFALWDADLVLTAPFDLITQEGKVVIATSAPHASKNIYHITTAGLLGYSSPRKDTVSHFAGMTTAKLDGLLGVLCPGNSLTDRNDVVQCSKTIISNIPHDQPSPYTRNGHEYAFSEYNLYHSFVFRNYSNSVELTDQVHQNRLKKSLAVDCTVPPGSKAGDMVVFENFRAGFSLRLDKNLATKSATVAVNTTNYMKAFLETAKKPTCQNTKEFVEKIVTRWYCLDDIIPGNCTVYSFGIADQWDFDDFFHEYGCTVYSFDPSNGYKTYQRGKNHWFYSIGIGPNDGAHQGETTLYNKAANYNVRTLKSLMKEHGDEKIDVLRLDVEGAEWELLGSLISSSVFDKVKYFSAEVHMWQKHGFHEYFYHFLSGIPMKLLWASRNTDPVNKETRKQLSPGSEVTRVYELLWGH